MTKVSVLFVCMGNICRSPTAHGVFEYFVGNSSLADHIQVDSAGTHAYHNGEKPDSRSMQVAESEGYDLAYIRSRKISNTDFEEFDYIIAMDRDNLVNLQSKCPEEYLNKLHLFLALAEMENVKGHVDVPDPYYGGGKGFSYVLDLVKEGAEKILVRIQEEHFNV